MNKIVHATNALSTQVNDNKEISQRMWKQILENFMAMLAEKKN
jgi:hypothetical protein